MIFALSALLLVAAPQTTEVHTELQVEAMQPPDRRAELAAEISRAQAELEEVRRVARALPGGEQMDAEQKRLAALALQIDQMRRLVADLPEPPSNLVPNRAVAPVIPARPVALQSPVASEKQERGPAPQTLWIALGFGLILGALVAFILVFRSLPGSLPKGTMRAPQLAILVALIAAVGPQLQSLGYDQLPIVFLWIILGLGVVIRMAMQRVRIQIGEFSIDRVRRKASEDDDE
jgi:hypothetical protein